MPEKVLDRNLDYRAVILDEALRVRLTINDELREKVVTGVLGWNRALNKGLSFKDAYEKGLGNAADPITNVINKYRIAISLIEDGRYGKPSDRKDLVRSFIPEDHKKLTPEVLEVAQVLKGELNLLLIKTGDISTTSEEAKEAEEFIRHKYEQSKKLEEWARADMPPEVAMQIVTIEECSAMTDEKKLEELRSWFIHALYRPYLGVLSGTRPDRDLGVAVDLIDRIPKQVFTHPYAVRYNLLGNYYASQFMKTIDELGIETGVSVIEEAVEKIEDPEKKKYLGDICEEVIDIVTYPYRGDFRDVIQVKDQDRIFPCAEQAAFCYYAINYGTRLFVAPAGKGKSGGGFLMMENSGAEKPLIIAPASVRVVWREQDQVVFENPGNVFIIRGSEDIPKAAVAPEKYCALSRELLGNIDTDPTLLPRLVELVIKSGMDGLTIDEIHNFANPKAHSTKALIKLSEVIRQNYLAKTGRTDVPVIGLTATPLRKDIADLNVPMAILYPEEYAISPAEATETKKTFSDTYLRNPHLTYLGLIGERRMFRWASALMLEYDTRHISASAFELLLYDFINTELGGDAVNKIRILENGLFNPVLVKKELLNSQVRTRIPEVNIDEVLEILKKTVSEWKKMRGIESPAQEADYLSADRLAELGLGQIVLGCFFSGLHNGIDTLVEEITKDRLDPSWKDLKLFWRSREISTKYSVLREELEKSLSWDLAEDGSLTREKVIVISPARRQGRTGDVLQKEIVDKTNGIKTQRYHQEELDRINDSNLLRLIKTWVKEKNLCQPWNVLFIDSSVSIGPQRDSVISRFMDDPNAAVLVVTLEAAYQGRDFTLNNLIDQFGRRIRGVHNIFLGPPWDSRQLEQMIGRSDREGHLVPSRSTILEVLDSVEQGKGEVIRFSYLLSQIALSGARLHPDDQAFLDSKRIGPVILKYRNPEANFLRDVFRDVKGKDPEEIIAFLKRKEKGQEKTNAQRVAERFYDNGRDAYKMTGYNAEMIASLVRKFGLYGSEILSAGAGTLLLQRKLKRGIDNVDYNLYMMEEGWKEAGVFGGRKIEADSAELDEEKFPNGFYDFVDSAFALDWAKLGNPQKVSVEQSVRVKVLRQINRMLKDGGVFVFTISEKNFDDDKFNNFINTLEAHFGFQIDYEHSGKSFGISKFGTIKRLGWCVVARKTGDTNLTGLQLRDLEFCTDSREWESKYEDKKGDRGGPVREDPSPDIGLSFDRYQIIGLKGETTEVNIAGDALSVSVDNSGTELDTKDTGNQNGLTEDNSEVDLSFLRGQTLADYRSYRKSLIRKLQEILPSLNWTEAENYGISILQELIQRGRLPRDRAKAYYLIQKEVRKRSINN